MLRLSTSLTPHWQMPRWCRTSLHDWLAWATRHSTTGRGRKASIIERLQFQVLTVSYPITRSSAVFSFASAPQNSSEPYCKVAIAHQFSLGRSPLCASHKRWCFHHFTLSLKAWHCLQNSNTLPWHQRSYFVFTLSCDYYMFTGDAWLTLTTLHIPLTGSVELLLFEDHCIRRLNTRSWMAAPLHFEMQQAESFSIKLRRLTITFRQPEKEIRALFNSALFY